MVRILFDNINHHLTIVPAWLKVDAGWERFFRLFSDGALHILLLYHALVDFSIGFACQKGNFTESCKIFLGIVRNFLLTNPHRGGMMEKKQINR